MKTLKKTLPLLIASVLIPAAAHPASADGVASTGMDVGKIIDSEVTFTRKAIDAIAREVSHKDEEAGKHVPFPPDYVRTSEVLLKQLDATLGAFEKEFRDQVLAPKLAPWIAEYNTNMSMKLSDDNRVAMDQFMRRKIAKDLKDEINPAYQSAINKVYNSLDLPWDATTVKSAKLTREEFEQLQASGACPQPMRVKDSTYGNMFTVLKWSKKSDFYQVSMSTETSVSHRKFELKGCQQDSNVYVANSLTPTKFTYMPAGSIGSGQAQDQLFSLPEQFDPFYQSVIYPYVADGCETAMCKMLRGSDIGTIMERIRRDIDRDITFQLSAGRNIELSGVDRPGLTRYDSVGSILAVVRSQKFLDGDGSPAPAQRP